MNKNQSDKKLKGVIVPCNSFGNKFCEKNILKIFPDAQFGPEGIVNFEEYKENISKRKDIMIALTSKLQFGTDGTSLFYFSKDPTDILAISHCYPNSFIVGIDENTSIDWLTVSNKEWVMVRLKYLFKDIFSKISVLFNILLKKGKKWALKLKENS